MNLYEATTLVTNLYVAQLKCDQATTRFYAFLDHEIPKTDHAECFLFELDEEYGAAHNALETALTDALTPENALLHTVALVWAKRAYEANDYFNE